MGTQIEWNTHVPISAEAGLFLNDTTLRSEPSPAVPSDPLCLGGHSETLRYGLQAAFRIATIPFHQRQLQCEAGLFSSALCRGRAPESGGDHEEITYTKKNLTDYLDKGWIRPSYSRTSARLFFLAKQNGSLRSVVDFRALNEVLETQYFPPPEWSNIVIQLGDAVLSGTFDCADFFFQNRLRDVDSWMAAFSTYFGQFKWRVCRLICCSRACPHL